MTGAMKITVAAMVMAVLAGGGSAYAQAAASPAGARRQVQPRSQIPPKPQAGDQITAMDIEAMFQAMTVMEAERFLALTPEQFPIFVQRLKKVQEARTTQIRRHNRALGELRAMANSQTGQGDDAAIDNKLKELDTIEAEARVARAKAMDAMDQLLSIKQRARFRLLEDNIEKKKLDFLIKVRQQGGRGGN